MVLQRESFLNGPDVQVLPKWLDSSLRSRLRKSRLKWFESVGAGPVLSESSNSKNIYHPNASVASTHIQRVSAMEIGTGYRRLAFAALIVNQRKIRLSAHKLQLFLCLTTCNLAGCNEASAPMRIRWVKCRLRILRAQTIAPRQSQLNIMRQKGFFFCYLLAVNMRNAAIR